LLEDLCIALRHVGGCHGHKGAREYIAETLEIAAELDQRGVSFVERLNRLTQETGWLMARLFDECRRSPETPPEAFDIDGVRRWLRCLYCNRAEHPKKDHLLYACDGCLEKMIESFDTLNSMGHTVFFRTYDRASRCNHADEDTVLLSFRHEEGINAPGRCKRCLQDELADRRGAPKRPVV
jgi:hypothetical protein